MQTVIGYVIRVVWLGVFTMVSTGCQTPPSKLESNFGSSVRHAVAVQTAPESQAGYGLDGKKGEEILGIYRTDVAKPEEVEEDLIEIRLGK